MKREKARKRGPSLVHRTTPDLLRPSDPVRLVHHHLSACDLRRIRECGLQALLAQPGRCDPTRLVGLRRGVEEADGAHDAVADLEEVVAGEAGQLAQLRREALVDLLGELVGATLVDTLVTSDGGMHVVLLAVTFRAENPLFASSRCTAARCDSRRGTSEPRRLPWGLRALSTLADFLTTWIYGTTFSYVNYVG